MKKRRPCGLGQSLVTLIVLLQARLRTSLCRGRLPEYLRLYEFVTRNLPLTDLTADSHIGARAAALAPAAGFSARIREGVPQPTQH